ncbi:DUF2948 family protein [Poseidonocella sedimentorum]|uniref:DUF2948 domain-containing protein n=1 Tax=Poseidonocella sedimentorum TaxID=871652 RepID=A0A1I6CMQ2_9RHOB|nr:DUF2948 family protein [Poseidonocella sedimentorum]SFQ94446.1 Protein of unknown function [Poseidonocella sedimentorum]
MSNDARFEDGGETPINLGALDVSDLEILSSLVQDAVFPITEMRWLVRERQLAFLINRFRWEDPRGARAAPERVRSVLVISEVERVSSQGVDRNDHDTILSLLSLSFEAGEDGTGAVLLTLAGDGAIRAEVEALDVRLRDVTRPYSAPSGKAPHHEV